MGVQSVLCGRIAVMAHIEEKLTLLKQNALSGFNVGRRKPRGFGNAKLLKRKVKKKNSKKSKNKKSWWPSNWFSRQNGPVVRNSLQGNETFPERPYRLAQPMIKPKFDISGSGNRCTIVGQDFMSTLSVTTAQDVAGTVIYNIPINPAFMKTTRLQMQCALFELFKFKRFRIIFKPTLPIQNGVLLGWIDSDVDDDPGAIGTVTSLQAAMAHASCRESPVCETQYWDVPPLEWTKMLWCDINRDEPRMTCQGRFVLVVSVPMGLAATVSIGQLYAEYEVELSKAQLDNNMAFGVAKWSSSTGTDATHPWGTTVTFYPWNSMLWKVPPAGGGNTFKIYSGTYLFGGYINGTGITVASINPTGEVSGCAVTNVVNGSAINGAATSCFWLKQFYLSTEDINVQVTFTATTVTTWMAFIQRLPEDALTMKQKLMNKASKLVKEIKTFEEEYEEEKEPFEKIDSYIPRHFDERKDRVPLGSIQSSKSNRRKDNFIDTNVESDRDTRSTK